MLPEQDINEIVLLFANTSECSITLYSQFHTIPDLKLQSGPYIYGIECTPRNGAPKYIIQKSMLEAELRLIGKDYHYYKLFDKKDQPTNQYSYCNHQWVDVGFHFTKLVCKQCDKEKGDTNG